jgi:hypothetical protein
VDICVSFLTFKIALKYLKNNLSRPFENCEFTPLLNRITILSGNAKNIDWSTLVVEEAGVPGENHRPW